MSSLQAVRYAHAGVRLTGQLARPVGPARAAIVVFPTIVNANTPVQQRAQMLSEQGCLTMIADFYGERVDSFEASRPLAEKLRADPGFYRARIAAAIAAIRAVPGAAGLKVGAVGYCMGGGAALEAARDGQDLAAVVSFHGLLDTQRPAEPGAIKARLLVCHGDADPMVPRDQVIAFWQEMDRAGADWHFHSFAGVKHGFTDPGSDARGLDAIAYNPSADRQSWAAALNFLYEIFG